MSEVASVNWFVGEGRIIDTLSTKRTPTASRQRCTYVQLRQDVR